MSSDITEDSLLGGRVGFSQPAEGYRAAIDPVLLAAAITAADGETVLDAGSGAGAASLCLMARLEGVNIRGIEADAALTALANRNAEDNGFSGRAEFVHGDILDAGGLFAHASFDHVMCNPPYFRPQSGNPPPDANKASATVEGAAGIGEWVGFCVKMVRHKGSVTFIHHAERLDSVLSHMHGHLGGITVFPLWPDAGGKSAKRVIVTGRKGMAAPSRMAPGLVLHGEGGAYTPEAEAILRDGSALTLP